MSKADKTIGLLRKLQAVLPPPSLVIIYKAFIRPHLNYWDIIYDQAYKESFHQKLESIKYIAALAITGTTRSTFSEKLYQELGLEIFRNDVGIEKCATFSRYLKINLRIIFAKYFLALGEHITQERLITFSVPIPTHFFQEFLFSHQV